jgi:hypothetical protein
MADLGHAKRDGRAVVAARGRETRQGAAVEADGFDADAVAYLKRFQCRREGVAIGAVAAEEEQQHMVATQLGDRARAITDLLGLEDFQRLGVDRASLQRGIELGRGPGDPLRHVGEGRSLGDDLGLQFHVAPHVGLGRPHHRDAAQVLNPLA